MWTVVNKPTLSEALGDIDPLVDHCENLSAIHKQKLAKLYHVYSLKGYATDQELKPLEDKKEVIKNQYSAKMTGNNTLGYVRKDLFANVWQCPMCGINEASQLDHYMCESNYGQLACCRLNLIPTCGVCNRKKSQDAYTDYIHAYYDLYPTGALFLTTKITIKNNHVGLVFSIDNTVIGNSDLARRTQEQFTRMDLKNRLHKAGILFLNNLVRGLTCKSDKELQTFLLSHEIYLSQEMGNNHWQTSLVRGLRQCAAFNITVVNAMRRPISIRPVNGGGA